MTVSLYRKYRPIRFQDVIGQEHIARTLINAIEQDRVSHAYLFAGPRGIGKTSTAKILAMALNCEAGGDRPTPMPDGTCSRCESIRRGTSFDVVEMDAASHRTVEEITETLLDKVHFAPVEARRKVYILDEVHMLSSTAFNALLKTLEEPPGHAVFVLATTEPHKVPATIMSRCQRFDFRRPSTAEVVRVLDDIAKKEGIEVAEAALTVIARAAGGSFRDAVGLLDQLSVYTGAKITLEQTLDILGMVRQDLIFDMVDRVHAHDPRSALLLVERLSQAGADYAQFMRDLLAHLRDLYVVKHAPDVLPGIAVSDEQMERMQAQAAAVDVTEIVGFLDLISEALRSVRQGSDPRLELEMALIKIAASVGRPLPADAPPSRQQTPGKIETAPPIVDQAAPAQGASAPATPDQPEAKSPAPARATGRIPADLEHLKRAWPRVVDTLKKRQPGLAALLAEGKPDSLQNGELVIRFPAGYTFQASQVTRENNSQAITQVLQALTGEHIHVTASLDTEPAQPVQQEEDARILSRDELLLKLKQEFDAEVVDEEPLS